MLVLSCIVWVGLRVAELCRGLVGVLYSPVSHGIVGYSIGVVLVMCGEVGLVR